WNHSWIHLLGALSTMREPSTPLQWIGRSHISKLCGLIRPSSVLRADSQSPCMLPDPLVSEPSDMKIPTALSTVWITRSTTPQFEITWGIARIREVAETVVASAWTLSAPHDENPPGDERFDRLSSGFLPGKEKNDRFRICSKSFD